jgi:hypothetical protein
MPEAIRRMVARCCSATRFPDREHAVDDPAVAAEHPAR